MSKVYCKTVPIIFESYTNPSTHCSNLSLFKFKPSQYYHCISNLRHYLDDAELDRAERYHFEIDSNRFIICRALLKWVLSKAVGLNISKIHLKKDAKQKPYLPSHPEIFFNISHTKDFAVIALSNTPVGIDVEYINRDFDFSDILPYSFSKQEASSVLKSNDKATTFFKIWTRKEAIVKATGKGIDDGFPLIPSVDGLHHINPEALGRIKKLYVLSFNIENQHVGAVAYQTNDKAVKQLTFYTLPTTTEELMP